MRIVGRTLVPEADLQARLAGLVGREVTFAELEAAAGRLAEAYSERGYVVRVLVPQQQIRDGSVTFRIIEGLRGDVTVQAGTTRIDASRVQRFVDRRVPAGAPLNVDALSEALAILNEQPGADMSLSLTPGRREGEVGLRLTAGESPFARWSVGLNNRGTRSTGAVEASAGLVLANPTGRFDEASLLLNASEGVAFVRGGYSLAVGESGLRLGVNASGLRYEVRDAAFAALQPRGTGRTYGITSTYPISRRGDHGLSATGSAELRELKDSTVGGETGNRRVRVVTLGVEGYRSVAAGPLAGRAVFSAALSAGDSDQRNAAALAADQAARRTQGSFTKMAWAGSYEQLVGAWIAGVRARGQFAGKNLDSSERMSLGGSGGVRAYPVGEAVGDEGWVGTVSGTWQVSRGLRLGVFQDVGRIEVNHTLPPGGTATPNRYTLSGAGVSLDWIPAAGALLSITVAAPTGSNPARDALGRNVDGSRSTSPRAWLSLTAQF